MLQATNIHKAFAGVQALKGVSFDLNPGEVHALVGENGAGKSTLIKILAGACEPDAGTVEIGSQRITSFDPVVARAMGIAAIYQQPALCPDLTVAENIALGNEAGGPWRRIRWGRRRDFAGRLLARVGAEIDPDTLVADLSMPEQQLVEIARALGASARVLIMDEPTASLSEREVERLFRVIRDLRQEGVGIIYISHRLEELFQVADRVTVLRDGSIVGTRAQADVSKGELIRMMVGRELASIYPPKHARAGAPVLELESVGYLLSGVRGISLTLHAGEILGLAGLVGAGRTELANVLFGITPADQGQIRLRGKPVTINSPAVAIDLGIGYVPEDRRRHGVLLDMAITQNTSLAALDRISRLGFLNRRRERSLASTLATRLDVRAASLSLPAGSLSGGNQQKVAIARWLATEPSILILDEPTQGIDVGAKGEIHHLIGTLAERGLAILLISSELPEILGMSDRIAVMRAGSIVGTLNRDQATQEEVMALAFGHAESPS